MSDRFIIIALGAPAPLEVAATVALTILFAEWIGALVRAKGLHPSLAQHALIVSLGRSVAAVALAFGRLRRLHHGRADVADAYESSLRSSAPDNAARPRGLAAAAWYWHGAPPLRAPASAPDGAVGADPTAVDVTDPFASSATIKATNTTSPSPSAPLSSSSSLDAATTATSASASASPPSAAASAPSAPRRGGVRVGAHVPTAAAQRARYAEMSKTFF